MNKQPHQILADILEIIEYTEDKNIFTNRFLELCDKETLINLIEKIPQNQQQELASKLQISKTGQEKRVIFNQYFSEKQYQEAMGISVERSLSDFLENITPTLSEQQLDKLQHYLNSISKLQS